MAKTRRARRLAWISVSALAGLIFYYFYDSRSQVDPPPAPATVPDPKSSDPSLSGRRSPLEAAPAAGRNAPPQATPTEIKLAVNGVKPTAATKTPPIYIDGRTCAPCRDATPHCAD